MKTILNTNRLVYSQKTNTLSAASRLSIRRASKYQTLEEFIGINKETLPYVNVSYPTITTKAMEILKKMDKATTSSYNKEILKETYSIAWKNPHMIVQNPTKFSAAMKQESREEKLREYAKPLSDALTQMSNKKDRSLVEDPEFIEDLLEKTTIEPSLQTPLQTVIHQSSIVYNKSFRSAIKQRADLKEMNSTLMNLATYI